MLAFFRRWREKRPRALIAAAIAEQLAYEPAHAARQRARLAHHVEHQRHGDYDPDQRALSVELKVRSAYLALGKKPPRCVRALVIEALS